jgi:hypothetical protein
MSEITPGSGLFAGIDRALYLLTAQFIALHDPAAVLVDGADGKRNDHNARAYRSRAPVGYSFSRILHPGHQRAGKDGCIGVVLLRDRDATSAVISRILFRDDILERASPLSQGRPH